MNKFLLILIALVLLCTLTLSTTACSPKNRFVGQWIAERSVDSFPGNMVLREDGTAVVDGYASTWHNTDNMLSIKTVFKSYDYYYRFNGSKLFLQYEYSDFSIEYTKR